MLSLEEQFTSTLSKLPFNIKKVAVAVSGGSDSMALLSLTYYWAQTHNIYLECLIVNHGLRPSAAQEALFVEDYCKIILKIPCTILNWHSSSYSNLQSKARTGRYTLMKNYCIANGINFLFTGHHLDDQAETFCIRLERGSGLDGLCAMPLISNYLGIFLVRPLLNVTKATLIDYLVKNQIKWVEDESNQYTKYKRSFYRNILANSSLLKKRLALTCSHLQDAREAINFYILKAFQEHVNISEFGYLEINKDIFNSPHAISTKLLALTLMIIGGKIYKPRFNNFSNLFKELQNPSPIQKTLHGCKIITTKNSIIVIREAAAISNLNKLLCGKVTWDHRFMITNTLSTPFQVTKITSQNREQFTYFKELITSKLPIKKQIASDILLTLPFIKDTGTFELYCPLLQPKLSYLNLVFLGQETLNRLMNLAENI